MKVIRNDSLQSKTIYLQTENGTKEKWLQPKESIVVPESYISEQIRTFQRRRILNVKNA